MKEVKFYGVDINKGDIKLYPSGVPEEIINMANNNSCILHPVNMFNLAVMADSDPTHRACLDLKSMMAVGLGYEFTNKKTNSNRAFKEFIDTPNMSMFRTFQDILDALASDYMTFGNGYLEFTGVGNKKALYHLISRDIYIKPKQVGNRMIPGLVDSYHQILRSGTNSNAQGTSFNSLFRGDTMKTGQHYVAHMYQYNPQSSYYGIPSYLAATPNISENVLIRQHGIRFFSNSARPDMALLISNGDITPEEVKKIKDQLSSYHKGIENAHRFFIFSIEGENAKVELQEISKTIDGQFLLESAKNRDSIAMIHQVPPKVLGISSAGSLGSGSETIGALKNFVETAINPLQTKFENFINTILEVLFGFNPGIKFNKIDLTNAKDDAIIETMLSKIVDINGRPAMSVSEIREKHDLPEKAKGDLMVKPKSKENTSNSSSTEEGEPRVGVKIDQQDKIETVDEENPENKPN